MSGEKDLLFGVMAVQLGYASSGQVVQAASGWASDRKTGLAQRLEDAGIVAGDKARLLHGLVSEALEANDNDPQQTIASLGASQAFQSFGGSFSLAADGSLAVGDGDTIDSSLEGALAVTDEHVGRYRLGGEGAEGDESGAGQTAEIGRGGIGRVLLAFDEHLGREVAIKELLTDVGALGEFSGPGTQKLRTARSRFLREARVTGQLEHPNIVPVYELGQRKSGGLYYSMRMVRGRTLSEALAECRSLPDRLKLLTHFVALCQALAYAHSRGVIHRDVKPDNVMLGEFGETVVLDWGLAKVRGKRDIREGEIEREIQLLRDAGAGRTVEGSALGTPAYMSPEQAEGEVELIDERSDVWSLGGVLYQILTGRPPYEGLTAYEVIGKVLKEPVDDVLQLCPDAPADLVSVCQKALCRNPQGRYSGAGDLASEVERYLTGGRVKAYEYRTWELLGRFAKRHKGVLSVVLLAILAMTGLGIWSHLQVVSERNRAVDAELDERLRRAEAQLEGSRAAFMRGDIFEARAKLRGSLETRDSAAARNMWRKLRRQNEVWVRRVGDYINGLDYSPDGRWIALGADGYNAQIIDARTRDLVRVLRGHTFYLNGVSFSPDSKLLASASADRTVRIWDVDTGATRMVLKGHSKVVWYCRFSPDGKVLGSSSSDGTIRLWNVQTGKALHVLRGGRLFSGLAFSPEGKTVYGGGSEGLLYSWNVQTGKQDLNQKSPFRKINFIDVHPGGGKLAISANMGAALFDLPSRKFTPLKGHTGAVSTVRFNPRGDLLVTAGMEGQVRVWDAQTGVPLSLLEGHTAAVYAAAFSDDGRRIASSGWDLTARVWNLKTTGQARTVHGHGNMIWDVAFSPDGQRIMTGGDDDRARVWSLKSGEQLSELAHGRHVMEVSVGPQGKRMYTAGVGSLLVWDSESGNQLLQIGGRASQVREVIVHPDGVRLFVLGSDGKIRVWNSETGGLLETMDLPETRKIALSPRGDQLTLGLPTGELLVHDLVGSCEDVTIPGLGDLFYRLMYSPNGEQVATVSGDLVRLWDLRTQTSRIVWQDTLHQAYRLDFTPDGKRIAFSVDDGEVLVVTLADGKKVRLLGHSDMASGIAIDPSGRYLASTSEDASLRVWDLSLGRPLWRAAAILNDPVQIYSHRGWQLLESGAQLDSGTSTWREVVERQGRWLEQFGQDQACLWTWDDEIQLWDLKADKRKQQWALAGVRKMIAVEQGCLCLRQNGQVNLLLQSGVVHSLVAEGATAMAWDRDQILVAAQTDILLFSHRGQRLKRLAQVDPGVSALLRQDDDLVLGYQDGNVELFDLTSGRRKEGFSFDDLSSRPVQVLRSGPMSTLLIGFSDGLVGIWDPLSGQRMDFARLHGPIAKILKKDKRVYVVSELGDHDLWDLNIFESDYCRLLDEVWAEVPVLWVNGRPAQRKPPPDHPCRIAQSGS